MLQAKAPSASIRNRRPHGGLLGMMLACWALMGSSGGALLASEARAREWSPAYMVYSNDPNTIVVDAVLLRMVRESGGPEHRVSHWLVRVDQQLWGGPQPGDEIRVRGIYGPQENGMRRILVLRPLRDADTFKMVSGVFTGRARDELLAYFNSMVNILKNREQDEATASRELCDLILDSLESSQTLRRYLIRDLLQAVRSDHLDAVQLDRLATMPISPSDCLTPLVVQTKLSWKEARPLVTDYITGFERDNYQRREAVLREVVEKLGLNPFWFPSADVDALEQEAASLSRWSGASAPLRKVPYKGSDLETIKHALTSGEYDADVVYAALTWLVYEDVEGLAKKHETEDWLPLFEEYEQYPSQLVLMRAIELSTRWKRAVAEEDVKESESSDRGSTPGPRVNGGKVEASISPRESSSLSTPKGQAARRQARHLAQLQLLRWIGAGVAILSLVCAAVLLRRHRLQAK